MKRTGRIIPSQEKGAHSDVSYSMSSASLEGSKKLYAKARQNLLNINNWTALAGRMSADFYLTGPSGKDADRLPLQGDYIKIHLPSSAKDKFDWVRIEKIEEEKEYGDHSWIVIRVRPAEVPRAGEDTAHFFSREATSSFIVERNGLKVTASVRGRNELPNTLGGGFFSKLRNMVIALAAMAGLNTPQWKTLMKGVLKN